LLNYFLQSECKYTLSIFIQQVFFLNK